MSFRIIASSPSLELSGANVLVANLLAEWQRSGYETEWLVTGWNPVEEDDWLGIQSVPVHRFPLTGLQEIRRRQALLLDHLQARAPCVYLPNFDFDMACIAPALPRESVIVVIVHCDEPVYYRHMARWGRLFNVMIGVSRQITERLQELHPHLAQRIVHVPFGVRCPELPPTRKSTADVPLEIAYCGRLSFYQKRVQDLAAIINRCLAERLDVRFRIAGQGPDEKAFFESIRRPLAEGTARRLGLVTNSEALKLWSTTEVMLLTSEFEGLPVVLLEAMSRGCVPLVTDVRSGVRELIQDSINGFLVPVGNLDAFMDRLRLLAGDRELFHRLSRAAAATIQDGPYSLRQAAEGYLRVFQNCWSPADGDTWHRPRGRPLIPPHYRWTHRIGRRVRRWLQLTPP